MDNKVAIGGKLEMDDFDRQWWVQVDVSEETFPIQSEFMHIRDLALRSKYCQCIAAGALWYW